MNTTPLQHSEAIISKGPVEARVRALLKTNRRRGQIGAGVVVLLALLAMIALVLVTLNVRFYAQPPQYISLAKLVAGGRMVSNGGGPTYMEYLQDFYGTIIETLESSEMRRKALDRVRALQPNLKEADVDVRITQNKGSAIFNVLAVGAEPKFTRAFLDALLDEFRSFRDSIREQQRNKALTALAEDVVHRERAVKEKEAKIFGRHINPELAKAESARLLAVLMELRSRRDAIQQASRGIAPTKSQEPLAAPVDAAVLEAQIKEAETSYAKAASESQEAERLVKDYEQTSKAYQDMFDLVRKFQVNEDMQGDAVAIMERATAAVQVVSSPWWIVRWGREAAGK